MAKLKKAGIGHIEAWPLGVPDDLGHMRYGVEEHDVRLRLHAKVGVWEVVTSDGRRIIVPVAAALVVWRQPARVRAPLLSEVQPTIAEIAAVTALDLDKPYACGKCGSTFGRLIDRMICERRDSPGPGYLLGDCRLCGYPLELHLGFEPGAAPPSESPCRVVTGEEIPHLEFARVHEGRLATARACAARIVEEAATPAAVPAPAPATPQPVAAPLPPLVPGPCACEPACLVVKDQ